MPYPPTTENVQAANALVQDLVHRLAVQRHGVAHWNAARMEAEFATAPAWGTKWNVPPVADEFAVYRKVVKAEDSG